MRETNVDDPSVSAVVDLAIDVRNVEIGFDDQPALLSRVSLQLARGQSLAVIGSSGQGKSTLLKLIVGLIQPRAGQVLISVSGGAAGSARRAELGSSSVDLWRAKPRDRRKVANSMAMLFQKNALFDSLSCEDNVAFPLREVVAMPEPEIRTRVAELLDAVGIAHAAKLFPDEISGGMQKRLGIARALALTPAIVLYDDPTAGLDPITSRRIVELIRSLQKHNNMTVVAVTNDMNRVRQIADRVVMVVDGEVLDCGSVDETWHHPDVRVQRFIRGQTAPASQNAAFDSGSSGGVSGYTNGGAP
jgi:phospholipid/cholesterol/gamma-HCH transport system ATP-binding protein